MEIEFIDTTLIVLNLMIAVVILTLSTIAATRLRGSPMYWTAISFIFTGIILVIHTAIEVFKFSEEMYALTALLSIIFLAFSVITIGITTNVAGVK